MRLDRRSCSGGSVTGDSLRRACSLMAGSGSSGIRDAISTSTCSDDSPCPLSSCALTALGSLWPWRARYGPHSPAIVHASRTLSAGLSP